MNTQRIVIFIALFSFMLSACEQNNSASTGSNSPQSSGQPAQAVSEQTSPVSTADEQTHANLAPASPVPGNSAPASLAPASLAMDAKMPGTALPPGHPAPTTAQKSTAQQNAFSNTFSGEVLETFDASTFTYVQIKTDNGPVWAAGPTTAIKKGDTVSFGGKTPMENFHSKSLNRTFEMIYFANSLNVNGSVAAAVPASTDHATSRSH
ncbi:MAG TPA: hypothetical protein ENJ08_08745 [Gammaproteobacteria bacterium]|nr:hypothetical protein [Gammaproteobacteria bacterium]